MATIPRDNWGGDLAEITDLQNVVSRDRVRTRQGTVESGDVVDPGRRNADRARAAFDSAKADKARRLKGNAVEAQRLSTKARAMRDKGYNYGIQEPRGESAGFKTAKHTAETRAKLNSGRLERNLESSNKILNAGDAEQSISSAEIGGRIINERAETMNRVPNSRMYAAGPQIENGDAVSVMAKGANPVPPHPKSVSQRYKNSPAGKASAWRANQMATTPKPTTDPFAELDNDLAAVKPTRQIQTKTGQQVRMTNKPISLGRKAANLRRLEMTQTSANPLMAGASKEAIGANKGPDMGRVKAANAAISPKGYAIEQAADDRPVVKGPGSKGLPKGRSMSRDLEWNNGTSMKQSTLKLQGGAALKDPFNAAARMEDQSNIGRGSRADAKVTRAMHGLPKSDLGHEQLVGLKPKSGGFFGPKTYTRADLAGNMAKDLGEAAPGATKAQASRGRSLAASIRENRSSIQSHDAPVETDLHPRAGGESGRSIARRVNYTATPDSGLAATPKSPDTFGSQNKDLGRVVAKAARGETAGEQPGLLKAATKRANAGRSIANIEGVMDAPKQSLASSLKAKFGGAAKGGGTVLGAWGGISGALGAARAYQGMKQGKAIDPLSLEPKDPKVGDTILTPQGKKKIRSVPVES